MHHISGKVLGLDTFLATEKLVRNVLDTSIEKQITAHELMIVWTTGAIVLAVMLWQLLMIIITWRRQHKFAVVRAILMIVLDLGIFFVIVVSHVALDQYVFRLREPHEIVAERVGESLLRVRWETLEPTVGIMIWGYDPEHVDNIVLGNAGEYETKLHDVLMEIEPQQQVYYYLLVNGVKHGIVDGEEEGQPFVVEVSKGYQLEEIEVTNK